MSDNLEQINNSDINIVYIDDIIDSGISRYLYNLQKNDVELNYVEVTFNEKCDDYKSLLNNKDVSAADILIVDSKLFSNENVTKKLTGEEFNLIFTTVHPYSEVIVITQNEGLEKYGTLRKYQQNFKENAENYYDRVLKDEIEQRKEIILQKRRILKKMKTNTITYGEDLIYEKVESLFNGNGTYKELNDDKINELIDLIEYEIKPYIEGDINGI
ncbi:hypothetical protein [Macrococcoides canis]|uniref:Uncharacterized protein n=1 Tax=Macrococcoides canis TaxID=1855823 RepID=A0A1W7ADR2_9STAP|nr:hypothetical protein [Macrococcus canis]ARQ07753.1 hypothetical protein MCCS_21640 [Macrococcus canis]